jgi:hypothetical protein
MGFLITKVLRLKIYNNINSKIIVLINIIQIKDNSFLVDQKPLNGWKDLQ